MKILWHGVPARFPTGYGNQTRLFTPALKDAGYDIVISSVVTAMPTYKDINGIATLSNGYRNNYGNDFILDHCKHEEPDIVISMTDTFTYECKKWAKIPWVGWQVVDSTPLIKRLVKPCRTTKINIAMSRFGERTMAEAGFESTYIPLCFNPAEYHPFMSREDARAKVLELFGIDWSDRYVVIMNSANMSEPSRKNFGAAFKAFSILHKKRPDAVMFCHTEATGQMARGEDLREIAKMYGLTKDCLAFPPPYEYNMGMLNPDYLRMMYSCSNLFLHTAMGEGFGLPLVEAQACGIHVVCPNFSSMPELIEYGTLIPREYGTRYMLSPSTEQYIVDPIKVGDLLLELYKKDPPRKGVPEITRYTVDNVLIDHLLPFLESAECGKLSLNLEK